MKVTPKNDRKKNDQLKASAKKKREVPSKASGAAGWLLINLIHSKVSDEFWLVFADSL